MTLDTPSRLRTERPRGIASAVVTRVSLGRAGDTPLVTLTNAAGMVVQFMGRGGTIVSMLVPDRDGTMADVVLGFDDPALHVNDRFYMGALVGRNANRIANASFVLNGKRYDLSRNDGENHLHGGTHGFNAYEWSVRAFERGDTIGAELAMESPAGDQGYPGTLRATATYTLTDANEFVVEFSATVDAPTPVNLTQHTYFNLTGRGGGTVLDHQLTVLASRITPVDSGLIPTGKMQSVDGTPFDFRSARRIGAHVHDDNEQLRFGLGYDHNFVLDAYTGVSSGSTGRTIAARLHDPSSGRLLELSTTKPGLQIYSGNELDQVTAGKGGAYVRHAGIALEPQHFPDTPNQPSFPTTTVNPGEEYFSRTSYRFLVAGDGQLRT